ncbi:MAG: tRNA-dihydrouridine synthase family protein [Bdellovibrionales bacterium]|nr:tRNA-dihydrouridine synthase family protein [Bdellovibrionales bacterium]
MSDIFFKHGMAEPILMLAPMEGITNSIFRDLIIQKGGMNFVATEFIRITTSRQKIKSFHRHSIPLQIQFMSAKPEELAACLKFLKEKGTLLDTDWVDLNVGCPSKRVNASGAGAALLLNPDKIISMIDSMREVHPGPLSLKTRVGYQSDENYSQILMSLAKCPLDFITIHARTKCAGFDGPVNLGYLKQAVESLPFPVIGNGDIWNADDAIKMLNETGVRGLMCGRGAIRNPLLFQQIYSRLNNKELVENKHELIGFFFNLLSEYQNVGQKKLGVFKEFSGWFSKHPLIGKDLFQAIKRSQSFDELQAKAIDYFGLKTSLNSSDHLVECSLSLN